MTSDPSSDPPPTRRRRAARLLARAAAAGVNHPRFAPMREFLDSESAGGLVLMAVSALALLVANSPLAAAYFGALGAYVGPLSLHHWINDGLMAVFFLYVGLEVKRELLDGELSTWPRRALPGLAAIGGVAGPALVYVAFSGGDPAVLRGWAIPAATDIAFALAVLSLLGSRVPVALKVFLAALAIVDDLAAVLIIALFYTAQLDWPALAAALGCLAALVGLNRLRVMGLWPYLALGLVMWVFVLRSGVHPTLAGVVLALTIPMRPYAPGESRSPLHRLEHGLAPWVGFGVLPVFGFANAGVSLAGLSLAALTNPVTLGVGAGLFLGKQVGVLGSVWLAVRSGLASRPRGVSWIQLWGVALICGVGFTISLFIAPLAFAGEAPQTAAKVGVLAGSIASGLAGWLVLRLSARR